VKTCPQCERSLLESDFNKSRRRRDGLNTWCRYCESRAKIARRGPPTSVRRRRGPTNLCPRCLKSERGSQPYCPQCKLDYQNETRAKKWSDRYANNESRRIETARAYATNLLARGKIRRHACVFCGDMGTQFHHYDYERKTRNFDDVCDLCHAHVHIFLKTLVDIFCKFGVRVV
jgi:hypothetical protein